MNPLFQSPEALKDPDDITEYPPFGASKIVGDYTDDDGQVVDDTLTPNSEPALPDPDTLGGIDPPRPKAPTRLLTGTVTLTAGGPPVKLLNRDPNRADLSLWATSNEATALLATLADTSAQVTAPAANTTLATIPASFIFPGWYKVKAIVEVSGTAAAADVNNFQIRRTGTILYVIPLNPISAGAKYETPEFLTLCADADDLHVQTGTFAGTATAVYQASIVVERLNDADNIALYTPLRLASDVASAAAPSASAVVNVPAEPSNLLLPCHDGELWASLPAESIVQTVQVSWVCTSK